MNALNPEIIVALQASLRLHWAAIANYTAQAAHFARWGYPKLATASSADANEEREHAARLLGRLETFDAAPDYTVPPVEFPRHDLPGILAANLKLAAEAAAIERAGILTARDSGDEITAQLFAENLSGSEASIAEIEATQKVISQITLENYLAAQL